jgi:CubicO group peptidase (beta-lactamase class C family)
MTTPHHFNREALDKASDVIDPAIAHGQLSGAVTLVWRRGAVESVSHLGLANRETNTPMARDTLFRIASMTKPVTSAAALMLVEEGKMKLDDPITKWMPEFADMKVLEQADGDLAKVHAAPRDITVEDLFTHRSGLSYAFASMGPIAKAYDQALGDVLNQALSPDAWLKALGDLPLLYDPGHHFHYSHSTDVLGFLVGRVSGLGLREFLMQRVFGPLGMKDTDFYVPPEKRDRAAVVYRQNPDAGTLNPVAFRQHQTPPEHCAGGGGLISTADDYLAFARMLLGRGEVDGVRLLKPETVDMMVSNRLTDEQRQFPFLGLPFWITQGFGLGVSMIMDPAMHAVMGAGSKGSFGWPGAFGTWWQADPVEQTILIYLIQNSMELGPEAVANIGDQRAMAARLVLPMWQKAVYAAFE